MSYFLTTLIRWHDVRTAVRDTVRIVVACTILPRRWRRMLAAGSLEGSLKKIERDAHLQPPILIPANWIVKIGGMFLLPEALYSKRKCLFRSLMIYYLFACARKQVTLHFGCRLDDKIYGHCWLSSTDVDLPKWYTKTRSVQEVVSRVCHDSNRGALWQTSYSQISATETAPSVLREKKSSAPCHARNLVQKRKLS